MPDVFTVFLNKDDDDDDDEVLAGMGMGGWGLGGGRRHVLIPLLSCGLSISA